MNLEKLIKAAKEIEQLNEKSKARSKAWRDLASDARKLFANRLDIERRHAQLDAGVVVDYSTAIDNLINALHSK